MSDLELFEEARKKVCDAMQSLSDMGAKDTSLTICAMLVPILEYSHMCEIKLGASFPGVSQIIESSNQFAIDRVKGGEA